MKKTEKITISGILLVIGIILPTIFHTLGIKGAIFLPMHIPVLIGGILLGGKLGLFLGIILPIINHLITDLPSIPALYVIVVELGLYGVVAGLLHKKFYMKLIPSLILAILVGRVAALIGASLVEYIQTGYVKNILGYLKEVFLFSLPGSIIQLVLVPLVVYKYEDSKKIKVF